MESRCPRGKKPETGTNVEDYQKGFAKVQEGRGMLTGERELES